MATVTVPVLKPLDYQGRSYVRGDRVTMRPVDALAASRAGQVSLSRETPTYRTSVLTPETSVFEPTTAAAPARRGGRGRYRRRDLQTDITNPTE